MANPPTKRAHWAKTTLVVYRTVSWITCSLIPISSAPTPVKEKLYRKRDEHLSPPLASVVPGGDSHGDHDLCNPPRPLSIQQPLPRRNHPGTGVLVHQ
ncbi:MAG: hypothetical protein EWM72_03281 [Nitrospira sp.]|nr:MAG: hypothetical protein EWM72_03281 [Nitrospira sp.]